MCVCVTTSAGEACDTQQAAQKQREFEWKAQQDRKAQAKQLTHIFALFWLCKRRRRKGALGETGKGSSMFPRVVHAVRSRTTHCGDLPAFLACALFLPLSLSLPLYPSLRESRRLRECRHVVRASTHTKAGRVPHK